MKILVCVGDGIGNVIMSTPTISALHSMGHEVSAIGNTSFKDGWKVLCNRPELKEVFDGTQTYSAKSYDLVIECVGGFKAMCNLVNVKKQKRVCMDFKNKSEIECDMQHARSLGWKGVTPDCFCGMMGLVHAKRKPIVGLHNGHHFNPVWKRKEYPYYEELYNKLKTKFCDIFLFGSKGDREDWMIDDKFFDLDIAETANLIYDCDIFIGTDSGLSHMAAALGVKTYILWGATSIFKNKPPKAELIRTDEICEPCQDYKAGDWLHGRWNKCKDWDCMKIPVDKIIEKVEEGLNG